MPTSQRHVKSIAKSGSAKLKGDVTLSPGTNITLNQVGQNIEIVAAGGSGTPGGADTQVQFNDGGAFGGDAGLVYNKTTDKLTVAGDIAVGAAIELGHASDTTLSRSAAGTLAVEGVDVLTTSNTKTVTNKTLDKPVLTGTPAAEAALGYDSTQLALNSYTNGQEGRLSRVVGYATGSQGLTNSVSTDQDYTALVTMAANAIRTGKSYVITLFFKYVTGTSSVTMQGYLKLGTTKVVTQAGTGVNLGDGLTTEGSMSFIVRGAAAPGAAANVDSAPLLTVGTGSVPHNGTAQPVALATNGTLAIVPGVTYSGTGSTETATLRGCLVEELN